jgi:Bacterial regulatory proteins, luxR family
MLAGWSGKTPERPNTNGRIARSRVRRRAEQCAPRYRLETDAGATSLGGATTSSRTSCCSRADRVGAIEALARGDSSVDPKVVEARRRHAQSPVRELTPREVDVLAQLAEGRRNAAIADRLLPQQARG